LPDIDRLNVEDLATLRARLAELRSAENRPIGTREQWAALKFDPLSPEIAEPFTNPGWDEECRELGVVERMAAAVLQKTKPELIATVRALADGKRGEEAEDAFFELLESFRQFQDRLELWGRVLAAAELRLLIAGSTIPPGGGEGAEFGEVPGAAAA
jgi:hypothetical protein